MINEKPKDYRERIKDRAEICEVELTYEQLAFLNQKVNDDINTGTCEYDALDYAYMYIKNHYCQ
jgi:hypothetical protein